MPHIPQDKIDKRANLSPPPPTPHTGDSKSCQYGDKAPLKPTYPGVGFGIYFNWCQEHTVFERHAFLFNPFSTFRADYNAIALLSSRIGSSLCNVMTRLMFNFTSKKHILFATIPLYYLLLKLRFLYENNQKRITVSINILASHKLTIKSPTNLKKKLPTRFCALC